MATLCYAAPVRRISQRELRNSSAAVMDAVEAGEALIVTRHGVDVGELRPLGRGVFVNALEVKRALVRLPRVDLAALRAESDAAFGPEPVRRRPIDGTAGGPSVSSAAGEGPQFGPAGDRTTDG